MKFIISTNVLWKYYPEPAYSNIILKPQEQRNLKIHLDSPKNIPTHSNIYTHIINDTYIYYLYIHKLKVKLQKLLLPCLSLQWNDIHITDLFEWNLRLNQQYFSISNSVWHGYWGLGFWQFQDDTFKHHTEVTGYSFLLEFIQYWFIKK